MSAQEPSAAFLAGCAAADEEAELNELERATIDQLLAELRTEMASLNARVEHQEALRQTRNFLGTLPSGDHILVTAFADGVVQVCTRPESGGSWGPAVALSEVVA